MYYYAIDFSENIYTFHVFVELNDKRFESPNARYNFNVWARARKPVNMCVCQVTQTS